MDHPRSTRRCTAVSITDQCLPSAPPAETSDPAAERRLEDSRQLPRRVPRYATVNPAGRTATVKRLAVATPLNMVDKPPVPLTLRDVKLAIPDVLPEPKSTALGATLPSSEACPFSACSKSIRRVRRLHRRGLCRQANRTSASRISDGSEPSRPPLFAYARVRRRARASTPPSQQRQRLARGQPRQS